jgi:hypothetical protein
MDKRHPLLPDVPTFKELGVDWVDGAFRGIGVPKNTPPEARKKARPVGGTVQELSRIDLAQRWGYILLEALKCILGRGQT